MFHLFEVKALHDAGYKILGELLDGSLVDETLSFRYTQGQFPIYLEYPSGKRVRIEPSDTFRMNCTYGESLFTLLFNVPSVGYVANEPPNNTHTYIAPTDYYATISQEPPVYNMVVVISPDIILKLLDGSTLVLDADEFAITVILACPINGVQPQEKE